MSSSNCCFLTCIQIRKGIRHKHIPGDSSAFNAEDPGSIPGPEDPWRRKWQPTLVILPGKSHGQKSLVGYSPWDCKESDTTERLRFLFFRHKQGFSDGSVGKESACYAGDPSLLPGSGRSAGKGIGYPLHLFLGFPCGSADKESTCNAEDLGSIPLDPWVRKIPWRRERLNTPVFWPGEFHGLYSPCSHKESDTTERLSLSLDINKSFRLAWKTFESKHTENFPKP